MPRRKQPAIPDELLDQLLAGSDARSALADGGLLDGLKKALAERALNAELDHHLEGGEPDGEAEQDGAGQDRGDAVHSPIMRWPRRVDLSQCRGRIASGTGRVERP